MTATLGGLDALVFTAGIGENSSEIRRRVCTNAARLGITLDENGNQNGKGLISSKGTSPEVWVIPIDEERMIARHTLSCIDAAKGLVMRAV